MSVATVPNVVTDFAVSFPADKLELLEYAVGEYGLENLVNEKAFTRGLKVATGVAMLRAALTDDVMRPIMALQGTSLGFRTDKDAGQGYPVAVVRDCLIEALLRGALPVGNEFNIISGRCYLTKEFYTRKLAELDGLTHFVPVPGVPGMKDGGALVPYTATWVHYGKPGGIARTLRSENGSTIDERIVVRVNAGMGADAILGKATRKFYKQIYELLSGIPTPDGEADDSDQPKPLPRTLDALTEKIGQSTDGAAAAQKIVASVPLPDDDETARGLIDAIHAADKPEDVAKLWDKALAMENILGADRIAQIREARRARVLELQKGK